LFLQYSIIYGIALKNFAFYTDARAGDGSRSITKIGIKRKLQLATTNLWL